MLLEVNLVIFTSQSVGTRSYQKHPIYQKHYLLRLMGDSCLFSGWSWHVLFERTFLSPIDYTVLLSLFSSLRVQAHRGIL